MSLMSNRSGFAGALLILCTSAVLCAAEPPQPSTSPTSRPAKLPSLALPPGVDHLTIPLVRAGEYLVTPVSFDGQDAGLFVVDTGTGGCFIEKKTAGRLGLKKLGSSEGSALGGTGRIDIELHPVRDFSFGQASAGPRVVASSDFTNVRMFLGDKVTGILGMEVLRELPFAIDFQNPSLILYRPGKLPAALTAATAMPVKWSGGLPILPATIVGRPGWFIFDSGNSSSADLSWAFMTLHGQIVRDKHTVSQPAFGIGGASDYRRADIDTIEWAGKTFTDVPTSYAIKMPANAARTRDFLAGMLGFGLLKNARITIDGERAWIEWLTPLSDEAYLQRARTDADRDPVRIPLLNRVLNDDRFAVARQLIEQGAEVNAADKLGTRPLMLAVRQTELVKLLIAKGADVKAKRTIRGDHALTLFASAGDLRSVDLLLQAGADVNYANTLGHTALYRAAEADYPEVVQALLKAGAKVDLPNREGLTPLMIASQFEGVDSVKALLKARPDLELQSSQGATALMYAAGAGNSEICRLVLDTGARVDQQGRRGHTALIVAAEHGRARVVSLLLERGADPRLKRGDRKTALEIAIEESNITVVRQIHFHMNPASK